MERPRAPLRELIDEDNRDILGTLNPQAWGAFQEAIAEAIFFGLADVQEGLERSLRMTSAIDGDHRRDIKEMGQGQKPPTFAMAVPVGTPSVADKPPNGVKF
jgi:hypothetical protein